MIKYHHTKVARKLGLPEGVKYANSKDFLYSKLGDYRFNSRGPPNFRLGKKGPFGGRIRFG